MKKILLVMLLAMAIIFISNQAEAYARNERDFIGAAYQARVVNCNKWIRACW